MAKDDKRLPAIDVGRSVRRWYQKRDLSQVMSEVTLAEAVTEAGIIALAHLMQRMTDEKAPMRVRDQIALSLGPKLAVEVRGRMGKKGGSGDDTSSIMEAYKIKN